MCPYIMINDNFRVMLKSYKALGRSKTSDIIYSYPGGGFIENTIELLEKIEKIENY